MNIVIEKTKLSYWVNKIFGILISLSILGFGVSCFYKSKLGSDPVSCFIDGIHRVFNVSYGSATFIYNFAIFVVILIFQRKLIRFGTVIYTFTIGIFVNITGNFLDYFLGNDVTLLTSSLLLIIGVVSLGIGTGAFIWLNIGMGIADILATLLSRIVKIPYTYGRVGLDILFTLFGFLLGGVIGIGTLVGMFGTGFIISGTIVIIDRVTIQKKNKRYNIIS